MKTELDKLYPNRFSSDVRNGVRFFWCGLDPIDHRNNIINYKWELRRQGNIFTAVSCGVNDSEIITADTVKKLITKIQLLDHG